jgi:hypothetical protein
MVKILQREKKQEELQRIGQTRLSELLFEKIIRSPNPHLGIAYSYLVFAHTLVHSSPCFIPSFLW